MSTLNLNLSKNELADATAAKSKLERSYSRLFNKLNAIKRSPKATVELRQGNFAKGTVVIASDHYIWTDTSDNTLKRVDVNTREYVFKLMEDIVFDPNNDTAVTIDNVTTVGKVQSSQFDKYNPLAFGIGFFAAIALSGNNVVIDLNGFDLSQSKSHNLTQRFYANIELASAPFLPGQGPHTFSNSSTFKPAKNCMICNGTMGVASHHEFHGNLQSKIIIKDIDASNYEVAFSSLNGGSDLYFENCRAQGSKQDIPVLGVFSALTFIEPYVAWMVSTFGHSVDAWHSDDMASRTYSPADVHALLKQQFWQTYDAVINGNGDVPNQFVNSPGSVDGNGYGMLFNARGVAVNGFPKVRTNPVTNVYLKDIQLRNHVSWVNEIPAATDGGPNMHDPVGAVL